MTITTGPDGVSTLDPTKTAPEDTPSAPAPPEPTRPGGAHPAVLARTAELATALGAAFDGFDTRMQALTADLDPDNVRTAGAMALETGMYANSLAKIVNDLIAAVHELAAGRSPT